MLGEVCGLQYNSEFDFEDGPPGEELLSAYFKCVMFEKKTKSTFV